MEETVNVKWGLSKVPQYIFKRLHYILYQSILKETAKVPQNIFKRLHCILYQSILKETALYLISIIFKETALYLISIIFKETALYIVYQSIYKWTAQSVPYINLF